MFDEEFWLAICIVAFIVLTYKPIKRAILGLLDKEIDRIRKELDAAEVLRLTTEKELKVLEQELINIKTERKSILERAASEAAAIVQEHKQELEHLLKRKEKDAFVTLENLTSKAKAELEAALIETARNLAEEYATSSKAKLPSDAEIAERLL